VALRSSGSCSLQFTGGAEPLREDLGLRKRLVAGLVTLVKKDMYRHLAGVDFDIGSGLDSDEEIFTSVCLVGESCIDDAQGGARLEAELVSNVRALFIGDKGRGGSWSGSAQHGESSLGLGP